MTKVNIPRGDRETNSGDIIVGQNVTCNQNNVKNVIFTFDSKLALYSISIALLALYSTKKTAFEI